MNILNSINFILFRVKIDDKMTTEAESTTQSNAVTMKDEDSVIFLDEDGPDAGLMFSPVIAEPELAQDSPVQREELSSVYNNQGLRPQLGLGLLTGLALAAGRC